MKTLRPLLDADGLVYRVGFTVKEDGHVSESLHAARMTVDSILDLFDPEPLMVLSGSGNFRNEVATILPYKGNRDKLLKPPHYDEIRQMLVTEYSAVVVDGREADDLLGETQWTSEPDSTCIVSQDKDMKTIRGWHYNWVKKTHFYVNTKDADLFLLWQVIQGDRTDNIPGLSGYGEKKASKIIKECGRDIKAVKNQIKSLYQIEFGDRWRETLHEVTTLLFIHREPEKTYEDYIGAW